MSSIEEIAIVAGSGAVGVVAGSLALYIYSKQKKSAARSEKKGSDFRSVEITSSTISKAELKSIQDVIDEKSGHRIIPKSELERSRRELKTLQLEKELVSGALTRLYEAEAAGEITRAENEILATKYRGELESLNESIQKIDALVEIGDLETLRDQLLRLVSQKIDAIEKRLDRTRVLAEPLIASLKVSPSHKVLIKSSTESSNKTSIPDLSDLLIEKKITSPKEQDRLNATEIGGDESPTKFERDDLIPAIRGEQGLKHTDDPPIERRKTNPGALKAEELQKDILEALDRLEKLDIDS